MIGADAEPEAAKPEVKGDKKDEDKEKPDKEEEPADDKKDEKKDDDKSGDESAKTENDDTKKEGDTKKEDEKKEVQEKEADKKEEPKVEDDKEAKEKKAKKPPLLAFFDVDGDGAIKGKEAETAILDFNDARKLQRGGEELKFADLVAFPSRTKTIAYPLLFRADAKGNVPHVTIGAAFQSHGTHVSGIIAGNGEEIVGAAPEAEIMAIKACSGFSCTEAAIIRGLLAAFFNPQGYVPDVVNISLGSNEEYSKDRTDILIQDLAAKFGTVFCVSASNSGTGYRSINHIGSLSPAIVVGAHVSRQTLARHYRLQDGVDVPEHVLLYFTSLGPSYTGQLRPNIIAPGSALSATSLIDDGSSMYNGTSMSSPITAGAVAALLSLARDDKGFAKLEEWRQKKIEAVQKKTDDAKYSLTSYALAVRTALEDSANELPDYTLPQQGHGLLDIDAAYDALLALGAKVGDGARLAEFEINGNEKSRRLYDRSNDIPPVKRVYLTLDADGELSEASWLKLRNAATEVRLVRVQVQDIDGTVQNIAEAGKDQPLPFSIAVPGKEGEQGREIVLVMSNNFKGSFYSVRRLDLMQAGKTYVAHYDVYQHDQRLFTLLDVVHKPIELSDLKTEVNLPGIDVDESNRVGCYINRNQPLKASAFHRYPVAVTERDSALNVELGFGKDQAGLLLVQVYDPDGYEAAYGVIRKSPQIDTEQRTTKVVVNTLEKRGIWEVTVSSFTGTWLGESGYDLLIEAYRFVPSVESLKLGSKAAPTPAPGSERIVSLMNSSRQVSSVSVLWGKTERISPLQPFGIAPNHRTYKKLPLPMWDAKQGGSKNTTIILELDRLAKINEQVRVRIDHRLYKKGADGKFAAAYKAEKGGASSGRKMFRNIPRPEAGRAADTLYVAVETVNVYPEGRSLSQVIDHVDMLVVYPDIPVRFKETLSSNYLSSDSTAEVKLLKISAPAEIIDETTRSLSRSSQATLKVETGDANLPELEIKLPITLTEKPKAPPGYRVQERARSTLIINTNHSGISAAIPVRVSQ